MAFSLSSPAFANGKAIPVKYARDGDNLSPPLSWSNAPPETCSFALFVSDADAPGGTFYHWAAFDIPAERSGSPEGVGKRRAEGFSTATNDFGSSGYDGPEPPRGHGVHHYHFRLAALDVPTLKLRGHASVADVWKAAEEHTIATAEVVGTYER